MKSLKDYIAECEYEDQHPVVGDNFAIVIREECLLESYVVETDNDGGICLFADDKMMSLLEEYGYFEEESDLDEGALKDRMTDTAEEETLEDFLEIWARHPEDIEWMTEFYNTVRGIENDEEVDEAKYQGREVKLGKPMAGDVKKSKVYVKGPKGNVVKVNFGDPNMKIKKSNPARRRSFRARHNCDNPGPRWKARYWSCRAW